MNDRLRQIAALLTGWISALPAHTRAKVYKVLKWVSGAATLAVLVLPFLPELGVEAPTAWLAIATGFATFAGYLADKNTADLEVDTSEILHHLDGDIDSGPPSPLAP